MFLLLFCHHWLSFKLSGVGLDLEPKMIESTNVVTQDKLGSVNTSICTLHHGFQCIAVPVTSKFRPGGGLGIQQHTNQNRTPSLVQHKHLSGFFRPVRWQIRGKFLWVRREKKKDGEASNCSHSYFYTIPWIYERSLQPSLTNLTLTLHATAPQPL